MHNTALLQRQHAFRLFQDLSADSEARVGQDLARTFAHLPIELETTNQARVPNPARTAGGERLSDVYEAKTERWSRTWSRLQVVPWPAGSA